MTRVLEKIVCFFKPRTYTLRSLGFPSYEQLDSIGLSRESFMARYVHPTKPRWGEFPEAYSRRILAKFWADYEELRKEVRDGEPS